jgi:hypothetical protein
MYTKFRRNLLSSSSGLYSVEKSDFDLLIRKFLNRGRYEEKLPHTCFFPLCDIWGYHSGDYETEFCLLGCDAV